MKLTSLVELVSFVYWIFHTSCCVFIIALEERHWYSMESLLYRNFIFKVYPHLLQKKNLWHPSTFEELLNFKMKWFWSAFKGIYFRHFVSLYFYSFYWDWLMLFIKLTVSPLPVLKCDLWPCNLCILSSQCVTMELILMSWIRALWISTFPSIFET